MQGNRIWSAQKSVMRKTSMQTDFSCIKSDTIYNLQLPLCLRRLSLQMDYTWTQNCKPCGPASCEPEIFINLYIINIMCRRNIVKVKNVKRNWTFLRFHLLCFGDLSTLNMRTDFSQTTYIWNVASQQQKQSPSASHPTNMINTETGRSWKRRSYSIILFFAFHVHIEKKVHIQQNQWKNVKHTILNQRCH